MTIYNEINEKEQQFLTELYKRTHGSPSVQISMYEIGAGLGMDREQASRATEVLMSFGFAEIRSLSGGIGITHEGIEEVKKNGGAYESETGPKLGKKPLIEESAREAVSTVLTTLKAMVPDMGLAFELLSELMADMKTIEAQMMSPRPKTPIVRECFASLGNLMEKTGKNEALKIVKDFLAD